MPIGRSVTVVSPLPRMRSETVSGLVTLASLAVIAMVVGSERFG